ncbi:MAG: hypothetical protein MPK62_01775 [Alphaproteobacteria bacterium]|nr:hypothetical protein [Alphaproteobacteria bacterium]MDA8029862.1 hypothetical protein [Alphaproteobacteria bacterium]
MSHEMLDVCIMCKQPFTRIQYREDYQKHCEQCRVRRVDILEKKVKALEKQMREGRA